MAGVVNSHSVIATGLVSRHGSEFGTFEHVRFTGLRPAAPTIAGAPNSLQNGIWKGFRGARTYQQPASSLEATWQHAQLKACPTAQGLPVQQLKSRFNSSRPAQRLPAQQLKGCLLNNLRPAHLTAPASGARKARGPNCSGGRRSAFKWLARAACVLKVSSKQLAGVLQAL